MPIYEFYCGKCNTIYNFFSRTINTEKVPDCPHCKNIKLSRRVSMFASLTGKKESSESEDATANFDEAKMEKAMAMLEKEAGSLNEDDPRQAAQLMRKLTEATGLSMGPGMEEAMRRLERGEDPEKIESEMGDIIEKEEPFVMEGKGRKVSGSKPKPRVDETMYEL